MSGNQNKDSILLVYDIALKSIFYFAISNLYSNKEYNIIEESIQLQNEAKMVKI